MIRKASPRWRFYARAAVSFSLCTFALGLAVLPRGSTGPAASAAATSDPMIAAAGDIACDPGNSKFNGGNGKDGSCEQLATSKLLAGASYAAVLPLGDNQYYCGSYTEFTQSYSKSWGGWYNITHPVVGNHEYITHSDSSGSAGCDSSNSAAAGYFKYFGSKAGDKGHGFYSYDIGAWHLIALNSNCGDAGGCGSGTSQYNWLKNDLITHSNACTLAYWHIPLFSSGGRSASNSKPFWDLLYQYHADVVLNGHDHIYERFAPQTPSASSDGSGIREFIAGTGGANHTSLASTARNSQVRNSTTFGILQLTLHQSSYDWRFVPEGGSFSDSGSQSCNTSGSGGGGDTSAPSAPTNLHGSAPASNEVDLSWNASSDNVGVAGYYVFRNGTQIGQSSSTSFTDTTTSGSTTYSYTVKAFDAAGNQSGSSNSASITTPSGGGSGSLTFTPIDDASVYFDSPTANFGSGSTVEVDNSPVKHFLLKFSVTGVGSKTVTNATLRLYCVNSSPMGGEFRSVSTSDWTEGTVTWNNAPSFGSTASTLGSVSSGNWYTVNVTSLIDGDGTVSIGVTSTNSDGADYTSAEGNGGFAPQLIVSTT